MNKHVPVLAVSLILAGVVGAFVETAKADVNKSDAKLDHVYCRPIEGKNPTYFPYGSFCGKDIGPTRGVCVQQSECAWFTAEQAQSVLSVLMKTDADWLPSVLTCRGKQIIKKGKIKYTCPLAEECKSDTFFYSKTAVIQPQADTNAVVWSADAPRGVAPAQ